MKKSFCLSCFFLFNFLALNAENSSLSATHASYNGNTLTLKGKVDLHHALGHLQSGFAFLEKGSEEGLFSSIFLKENVLLSLKNSAQISCGSAHLDFISLKGEITPKLGEMIVFHQESSPPLSITSYQANIDLAKEAQTYLLSKIEACDHVRIQYGTDFTLQTDHAVYVEGESPYLYTGKKATLSHLLDTIEAEKIELFPHTSEFILTSAQAQFHLPSLKENSLIEVSSAQMVWKDLEKKLLLKGNVVLFNEILGRISCSDHLELQQQMIENQWTVSEIKAVGKTQIAYQPIHYLPHYLVCYGTIHLDQSQQILSLDSSQQPLEYKYEQVLITSEKARVEYKQLKESIYPQKISLFGKVRLTHDSSARFEKCALADQCTYLPDQQTLILSSQDAGNILFWDAEQNLSISAHEVHIRQTEKGETVQGFGNVRFTFSSLENALLKKCFPFYQPPKIAEKNL